MNTHSNQNTLWDGNVFGHYDIVLLDGLLDYSDVLQKGWSFEYTLSSNELTGHMTIQVFQDFKGS
jgi:hypothetical protein